MSDVNDERNPQFGNSGASSFAAKSANGDYDEKNRHSSEGDPPSPPPESLKPDAGVEWVKDPANAHNWPVGKKIYHTYIASSVAFISTLASSLLTPGLDAIQAEFHTTSEVARLPYVFYVLGLSFGPIIGAPLAETYGRRPVYLYSLPIFALFTMGTGFGQNITTLVICRFLAGLFASPGLTIGSATVADVWPLAARAIPMSAYVTAPFLGPMLGPLIGGFVVASKGWRWLQWITLFFTVAILLPMLGMKETYKKQILKARKKKSLKESNDSDATSMVSKVAFTRFIRHNVLRPLKMLFTEPIPGLFALYVGFNFALQYSFYVAFPTVFQQQYEFDVHKQGLTFIGLGVGIMIGTVLLTINNLYLYKPRAIAWRKQQKEEVESGRREKASPPPPEWRLTVAFPGSLLIPIALFMFGWTARPSVHWIVPIIAEVFFSIGQLFIFMAATMYVMDTYGPLYGASAMSANSILRYMAGFAFPLFTPQMYNKLGVAWASSLLGFLSLALLPIPWCFWKWGPQLRSKSKFRHGN